MMISFLPEISVLLILLTTATWCQDERNGYVNATQSSEAPLSNSMHTSRWNIDPWDVDSPSALSVKKSSRLSSNIEREVVLTKQQERGIVDRHNVLRTDVSPTATKMRKMTWDDELAKVATTYSRKCIYEHNKARKHSRFDYIGENLYISTGIPWETSLVLNAVSAWDNEKIDYDYETRVCKPGKKCGHYTQTAWDDTFKVGCGVTICSSVEVNGRMWSSATLFACNYGPGGNYDRHPFVAGPSCSACDDGDRCQDKLCTNPKRDRLDASRASWSKWSSWSTCSKTCLGGSARRYRKCSTFVPSDCPGYSSEITFQCAHDLCDLNLGPGVGVGDNEQFHSWSAWGECSVTCGNGMSRRTRTCRIANACSGINVLMTSCNLGRCTGGGGGGGTGSWTKWGRWSSCSKTCGGGLRKKKRSCTGSGCPGRKETTENCNIRPCKIAPKWSSWTAWTQCTVTCGGGSKMKARRCLTGRNCEGSSETTEICNTDRCPGKFSAWTEWSDCSKTCGRGIRKRTRRCVNGRNCEGSRVERDQCNSEKCPVFSKWSSWGPCDVTCGSGNRLRTRTCSTSNSDDCDGEDTDAVVCPKPDCKTSNWSPWTRWGRCSLTCGGGLKTSSRHCNPGDSGAPTCSGDASRTKKCKTGKCPEYTKWSGWSACDVTCGEGTKTRTRKCQYGPDCDGPSEETTDCKFRDCKKSKWASWSPWSNCSETCGDGTRIRTRQCYLGNRGPPCAGDNDDSVKCTLGECEVYKPDEKDKPNEEEEPYEKNEPNEKDEPNERGKDPDNSDQSGGKDGAKTISFSRNLWLVALSILLFLSHSRN